MKRLVFLALLAGSVVLGVMGVGCQTYDFEPVTPQTWVQSITYKTVDAKHYKPNLWLLVDSSGSMNTNRDACTNGVCVTRMAALKAAMATFLSASGDVARMALTFFPTSSECDPANSVAVGLPDPTTDDVDTSGTLVAHANQISMEIGKRVATGGTPTGASVAFVGGQPGLQDAADGRDDFILLLTDGLPNCNDANTYSCTDVAQCHCTIDTGCSGNFCRKGCLDQDASAAQIAEQKKKGIRTIVLAFGSNTDTGVAADTLDAMATAGGANLRTCLNGTDAECETGGCVAATKLCRRQYYKASNAGELAAALKAISEGVGGVGNPCEITLVDPPTAQQYVAVIVNDENIPAGPATWTFTGNSVLFEDASTYCAAIKAQSSSTQIEIRYVQRL